MELNETGFSGAGFSSCEPGDTVPAAVKPALKKPKKSLVQIRLPQEGDWEAIRRIVRQNHARTVFSNIAFSERKYDALEKAARSPAAHQCLIVAEVRGAAAGVAWFSAGEYILGDDGVMTTTHLLAIDTETCGAYTSAKVFMRLVRGIVAWSQSIGSGEVLLHVTTGQHARSADRLLHAGGAQCLGGTYIVSCIETDKNIDGGQINALPIANCGW